MYQVAICGAQGYVGQALLSQIKKHPQLALKAFISRRPEEAQDLQGASVFPVSALPEVLNSIDILLLATPPETSMEIIATLNPEKTFVVDLSGAFRLPAEEFSEWYGMPHQCPEKLNLPYGLSPWNYEHLKNHSMVSNPGCYATCALMPLIPLLKEGVIESQDIIIDAKSGVSGAGKKLLPHLMFCEVANNFFPYRIGKHQHTPEIQKALRQFGKVEADILLTPHLLPIERGISMTIYGKATSFFKDDAAILKAIEAAYETAYSNYPLLQYEKISEEEAYPPFLFLKQVAHTPFTRVGYYVKNKRVCIFSCIDNLLKGAASQAIENINAHYEWPVETGLI